MIEAHILPPKEGWYGAPCISLRTVPIQLGMVERGHISYYAVINFNIADIFRSSGDGIRLGRRRQRLACLKRGAVNSQAWKALRNVDGVPKANIGDGELRMRNNRSMLAPILNVYR